MVHTLTSLIIT